MSWSRSGRTICACIALGLCFGCGHREARSLRGASKSLGKAVGRGDTETIRASVVPGASRAIDIEGMTTGTARRAWAKALGRPDEITSEAIVFIATDHPVRVVWTDEGWRFAEDPTDIYAQATPRQALRALVLATRNERWDVVVRLAPRRYRIGLSEDDLERAWTTGEAAQALTAARDRLARHLAGPIVADAHEAVLDMGDGNFARLEREHDRWVVVDF